MPGRARRAAGAQAVDVAGIGVEEGGVVGELGRNEDAGQAGFGSVKGVIGPMSMAQLLTQWCPGPPGLQVARNWQRMPGMEPEGGEKLEDGSGLGILGQLLDVDAGEAPALIVLGVPSLSR